MLKNQDTKSFELVTLLEKISLTATGPFVRFKNLLLFIFKYEKYEFLMNRRINNKKISNKEIIEIFIELFKEYVYLQELVSMYKVKSEGSFMYGFIDSVILDSSIIYNLKSDKIIIRVQYNTITDEYNIYIDTEVIIPNSLGFNLTEKNLEIFRIKDSIITLLNLFFSDILYIMINLFEYYRKHKKEE